MIVKYYQPKRQKASTNPNRHGAGSASWKSLFYASHHPLCREVWGFQKRDLVARGSLGSLGFLEAQILSGWIIVLISVFSTRLWAVRGYGLALIFTSLLPKTMPIHSGCFINISWTQLKYTYLFRLSVNIEALPWLRYCTRHFGKCKEK